MSVIDRVGFRKGRAAAPVTGAEDCRWSAISSAVDLVPPPPMDLVHRLLEAGRWAADHRLEALEERCTGEDRRWVEAWPGEHYRLLAALTATVRPEVVVEVGTFQGHGSLALLQGQDEARVVTYDIIPWQNIPGSVLAAEDFAGNRFEQRIGDLADPAYLETQLATLRQADLIFVDGPKDGVWEPLFVERVLPELTDRRRLVVFDDIRLLEMVQLWRDLPYPRIDATSLGHWSGTGMLWTDPAHIDVR